MGQQCKPYSAIEALPPLGGGVYFYKHKILYLILFIIQYLVFFLFLEPNKCSIFFERLFDFFGRGLYTGIMG